MSTTNLDNVEVGFFYRGSMVKVRSSEKILLEYLLLDILYVY